MLPCKLRGIINPPTRQWMSIFTIDGCILYDSVLDSICFNQKPPLHERGHPDYSAACGVVSLHLRISKPLGITTKLSALYNSTPTNALALELISMNGGGPVRTQKATGPSLTARIFNTAFPSRNPITSGSINSSVGTTRASCLVKQGLSASG